MGKIDSGRRCKRGHPIYTSPKPWWWQISKRTYTTVNHTIYFPKGRPLHPASSIYDHEIIHVNQQEEVGLLKYIFLYLFCLPLFWNPFRFKWEYEAYLHGSKWKHEDIIKTLRSETYGWLRHPSLQTSSQSRLASTSLPEPTHSLVNDFLSQFDPPSSEPPKE